MKKQLLTAVALVATLSLSELSAHIFGEGGIVDNTVNTALDVPGDVLNGPNRPHRRHHLFNRDDRTDYSDEFADYNPEL